MRIPQQAVQELQGLKSVYVVGTGNKAEPRQIEARYRVGSDWVVESGLASGERVIVEGIGKVRPGVPVRPVLIAHDGGAPATSGDVPASPGASEEAPPPSAPSGSQRQG
jgi:membrane fusion protein (multidrug efflux system)